MLSGPKPKPRNQIRHRVPPVHDWVEVPDVPFEKGPPLPRSPARRPLLSPPPPERPLGSAGQALWDRAWSESYVRPDVESLQLLAEQMDERVTLRVRVLRDSDWHDRQALRNLDAQVAAGLKVLNLAGVNNTPTAWPPATKRWWRALSRMPHCSLWSEIEWQIAADTAQLVAAYHMGAHKLATEIRSRERLMGCTPDARRDQRIRYVDPTSGEERTEDTASVTAMDNYRKMVEP